VLTEQASLFEERTDHREQTAGQIDENQNKCPRQPNEPGQQEREPTGRMDLGLRDRVYLATGGSRGLGFAAAQALVADGARVLLSAPHEATASSAAARLAPDVAADVATAWTAR
jgi:hypothetical protein